MLAVSKLEACSIMAAGRLNMTHSMKRIIKWLETRKAQAQFPVTFISTFNLSSLIYLFSFIIEVVWLSSHEITPSQRSFIYTESKQSTMYVIEAI